jgi:hypothetical protein
MPSPLMGSTAFRRTSAGHSWHDMQHDMQPYIETIDFEGVDLRLLNLEGLLMTKQGVTSRQ